MSSVLAALVLVVVSGAAIAAQPAFNGQLARHLGSPVRAALVNFTAGTILLLAIVGVLAMREGMPSAQTLARVPRHLWFAGGTLGALFVTTAAWATPKIGAGGFFATLIASQLIAAMLLDHFGLIGLAQKSLTMMRIAGAGLLVLGASLVVRG